MNLRCLPRGFVSFSSDVALLLASVARQALVFALCPMCPGDRHCGVAVESQYRLAHFLHECNRFILL